MVHQTDDDDSGFRMRPDADNGGFSRGENTVSHAAEHCISSPLPQSCRPRAGSKTAFDAWQTPRASRRRGRDEGRC